MIKDMETVYKHQLIKLINLEIGSSEKIISSSIGLMTEIGVLHEIKHEVYKVNNEKAMGLVNWDK